MSKTNPQEIGDIEIALLKGQLTELSKMKLAQLRDECLMWRNLWGWIPPEVKYYVARVGQTIGITMRNYKRYLGTLVDSHWILDELEVGCVDKVYDPVDDKTYFEKKIVKCKAGSLVDLQWIKERRAWEEFQEEAVKQYTEMQRVATHVTESGTVETEDLSLESSEKDTDKSQDSTVETDDSGLDC